MMLALRLGFFSSSTSICGLSKLNLVSMTLVSSLMVFPRCPMTIPGLSAMRVTSVPMGFL